MKINSNMTAVIAGNYLMRSELSLQSSTERLSSGYKLNAAKDDPAGYAVSSYMRAQLKALEKANDNANNGISVIETTEGAVAEIQGMIQRLNELAIHAATGTMSENDRKAVQSEVDSLTEEIDRTAKETDFNTMALLDGSFENKGYTNNIDIKCQYYNDDTKLGKYTFSIKPTADEDGNLVNEDGFYASYTIDSTDPGLRKLTNNATVTCEDGEHMIIKSNDGTELHLKISKEAFVDKANPTIPDPHDPTGATMIPNLLPDTTLIPVEVDLTGMGAMRLQIGANEGQILEVSIPEISLEKAGIDNLDCTTQESARESIKRIDYALTYTNSIRAKLGAYQNRLDHIIASLDITEENLTGSFSRIVDTDMAEEMTEYTRLQVMQQAGTTMLAQANEYPQKALQLLQ